MTASTRCFLEVLATLAQYHRIGLLTIGFFSFNSKLLWIFHLILIAAINSRAISYHSVQPDELLVDVVFVLHPLPLLSLCARNRMKKLFLALHLT